MKVPNTAKSKKIFFDMYCFVVKKRKMIPDGAWDVPEGKTITEQEEVGAFNPFRLLLFKSPRASKKKGARAIAFTGAVTSTCLGQIWAVPSFFVVYGLSKTLKSGYRRVFKYRYVSKYLNKTLKKRKFKKGEIPNYYTYLSNLEKSIFEGEGEGLSEKQKEDLIKKFAYWLTHRRKKNITAFAKHVKLLCSNHRNFLTSYEDKAMGGSSENCTQLAEVLQKLMLYFVSLDDIDEMMQVFSGCYSYVAKEVLYMNEDFDFMPDLENIKRCLVDKEKIGKKDCYNFYDCEVEFKGLMRELAKNEAGGVGYQSALIDRLEVLKEEKNLLLRKMKKFPPVCYCHSSTEGGKGKEHYKGKRKEIPIQNLFQDAAHSGYVFGTKHHYERSRNNDFLPIVYQLLFLAYIERRKACCDIASDAFDIEEAANEISQELINIFGGDYLSDYEKDRLKEGELGEKGRKAVHAEHDVVKKVGEEIGMGQVEAAVTQSELLFQQRDSVVETIHRMINNICGAEIPITYELIPGAKEFSDSVENFFDFADLSIESVESLFFSIFQIGAYILEKRCFDPKKKLRQGEKKLDALDLDEGAGAKRFDLLRKVFKNGGLVDWADTFVEFKKAHAEWRNLHSQWDTGAKNCEDAYYLARAILKRQKLYYKFRGKMQYVEEFYHGVIEKIARMSLKWTIVADDVAEILDEYIAAHQCNDNCNLFKYAGAEAAANYKAPSKFINILAGKQLSSGDREKAEVRTTNNNEAENFWDSLNVLSADQREKLKKEFQAEERWEKRPSRNNPFRGDVIKLRREATKLERKMKKILNEHKMLSERIEIINTEIDKARGTNARKGRLFFMESRDELCKDRFEDLQDEAETIEDDIAKFDAGKINRVVAELNQEIDRYNKTCEKSAFVAAEMQIKPIQRPQAKDSDYNQDIKEMRRKIDIYDLSEKEKYEKFLQGKLNEMKLEVKKNLDDFGGLKIQKQAYLAEIRHLNTEVDQWEAVLV